MVALTLTGNYFAQGGVAFAACLLFVVVSVFWYKARSRLSQADGGPQAACIGHRQSTVQEAGNNEQQRGRPVKANGGLGVRGAMAASRNPRRYHSITILTDSTPLLMETGDDFFARPLPRRSLRKESNNSSSSKQGQKKYRLDRVDDDTPGLPQDNGRRFATTNGVFAGGDSSEGMRRADGGGGGGGGRRVFTLPSLTRANSNATSHNGNKPYVGCIPGSSSSSASTACG